MSTISGGEERGEKEEREKARLKRRELRQSATFLIVTSETAKMKKEYKRTRFDHCIPLQYYRIMGRYLLSRKIL